jgi:ketosteroid isomerase-like protein
MFSNSQNLGDEDRQIGGTVRAAIEALVTEHAWLIDNGRAAEVAALYTEDARLLGIGPDRYGRAEISAWARQRQAMTERLSRHVQTNLRLESRSEIEVKGTLLLTLFRHDGPPPCASASPLVVGEYDDVYRHDSAVGWRIFERRLTILFGAA